MSRDSREVRKVTKYLKINEKEFRDYMNRKLLAGKIEGGCEDPGMN